MSKFSEIIVFSLQEVNKMITNDELETSERINLIVAIKIVINNALELLGIIPREEM